MAKIYFVQILLLSSMKGFTKLEALKSIQTDKARSQKNVECVGTSARYTSCSVPETSTRQTAVKMKVRRITI